MADAAPEAGFGIYIHWPFCQAKCPYCDFNSHVSVDIDDARWKSAYLSEINRNFEESPNRIVRSVFFGGGTPSLMSAGMVGDILDAIKGKWTIANDLEVTLEANPTSVEAAKFRHFYNAGVNRVSIGVQALNDDDLKRLGRLHSAREAMDAVEIAQNTFERCSFDLIYARQFQTVDAWRQELHQALSLGSEHLSLYQLTIEPNTAFGDRHALGRLPGLVAEDPAADMYELTQELCDAHGLPAYEVSNHARVGAMSRHNLIYWQGGDYIGIGPGAHGRLNLSNRRYATETERSPVGWLKKVENSGTGETLREELSLEEQLHEYVLMAMRLSDGLSFERVRQLSRQGLTNDVFDALVGLGVAEIRGDYLAATAAGRPILNSVIRSILDVLA